MKKVSIKQNPEAEIPLEIMAEHIEKLSRFGQQIKSSRLKQKTIAILLSHATGLSQAKINDVLDALPQLEKLYLK